MQVSTFANEPWRENVLGIDCRQIDENAQNLGKLVPQRFVFNCFLLYCSESQKSHKAIENA